MKNIITTIKFTLREALSKKVFYVFLAFSVVSLVILQAVVGLSDASKLLPGMQNAKIDMGTVIAGFEMMVSGALGTLLIFLAVFSSANFITSMLEKGTVDLFLSKPISRTQLLWGKFLGGCLVFIINILVPVIGTWLIISIKFNYYHFGFFWIIATYTFTFAALYAIVIFFGVLSRNSFPGIMTSYFIFVILSQLLLFGKDNVQAITGSTFLQGIIQGLYYIIPKTTELLGAVTRNLIAFGKIDDFQPVITTLLFLILLLVSADYLFRKKDF